jgi:hypothetical protein
MRKFTRGVLGLAAALVLCAGGVMAPARAWEPEKARATASDVRYDLTYTLALSGKPAGKMRMWQRVEGDRIITESDMTLGVSRGAIDIKIGMKGKFVETLDHKPVSLRSEQTMGTIPMVTEATFKDGAIELETTQGGQKGRSAQPFTDKDWLTPAAVDARVSEEVRAFLAGKPTAEKMTLRMMDATNGPVVLETTRGKFEKATIEIGGKQVAALKCVSTTSLTPGIEQVEYLNEQGYPLRTEAQMGGIPMTMTLVDPGAKDEPVKAAELGPELMVSTFVTPDRPIPGARKTKRASYLLSVPDGSMPDVPTVGAQTATRVDGRTVRVRVDNMTLGAVGAEEARSEEWRASTAMLAWKDPAISELTARALRGVGEDREAKCEALRRFVHTYINAKGLSVGFASATETAQTRQGDCTEHGVLLAAMMRAAGIPSRVVSGLIYADQFAGSEHIFGYHMWAQALIEGEGGWRWVDFDATLPDQTRFDATHIALGTSGLKDGETYNSMVLLTPLLGRLQLKVEAVE